jgi:hypothetical protein
MTREELIAALQKATGPAYVLDLAIAAQVLPDCWVSKVTPKNYTASIDAALTLVPEPDDSFWQVLTCGERRGYFQASVVTDAMAATGAKLSWHSARTPAIALCIAAVKARAA